MSGSASSLNFERFCGAGGWKWVFNGALNADHTSIRGTYTITTYGLTPCGNAIGSTTVDLSLVSTDGSSCSCEGSVAVTLPAVTVPIPALLKPAQVQYAALPMSFTDAALAADASCSFSGTGTLDVNVGLSGGLSVNVQSVATAKLDILRSDAGVLPPQCDWAGISNGCSIDAGGAGTTLVRWHTDGFSQRVPLLGGVELVNSGPMTFYAHVPSSTLAADVVQQVEPLLHTTLINNLAAIFKPFYLIQEPPADLQVRDSQGRTTGVPTGGGPPAQQIPGSVYVSDGQGYSAVLLFAPPATGTYTVTAHGAPGSPYSLSMAQIVPSGEGATQTSDQRLAGTIGPSGEASTCFDPTGGCGPLSVSMPTASFELAPPQPNPSFGAVNLRFELPERADVSLAIYDLAGRRVKMLVAGTVDPGSHTLTWGGEADEHRWAGAGVFFLRLKVGSRVLSQTIIRFK